LNKQVAGVAVKLNYIAQSAFFHWQKAFPFLGITLRNVFTVSLPRLLALLHKGYMEIRGLQTALRSRFEMPRRVERKLYCPFEVGGCFPLHLTMTVIVI